MKRPRPFPSLIQRFEEFLGDIRIPSQSKVEPGQVFDLRVAYMSGALAMMGQVLKCEGRARDRARYHMDTPVSLPREVHEVVEAYGNEIVRHLSRNRPKGRRKKEETL